MEAVHGMESIYDCRFKSYLANRFFQSKMTGSNFKPKYTLQSKNHATNLDFNHKLSVVSNQLICVLVPCVLRVECCDPEVRLAH